MPKHGDTKNIGGKRYKFHGRFTRKARAEQDAKQTRSHPGGFYCRIVKNGNGYELWMRKK